MKKILSTLIAVAITVLAIAQVPYNVNKKKYPLGDEFNKLLPLKLGKWNRYAFHDFVPGQEKGKVYYTLDDDQVYLTFGKAYSMPELNVAWLKIYDDAIDGRTKDVKQKNIQNQNNKYLLLDGREGYFFGWTRNLYYFSIETKNKTIADAFMSVFPF